MGAGTVVRVDLGLALSWGSSARFMDAAGSSAAIVLGRQVGEFEMGCRCPCCIRMRLSEEFRKVGVVWKATFWEGKECRNDVQGGASKMESVC